jgi:hypothetical protein
MEQIRLVQYVARGGLLAGLLAVIACGTCPAQPVDRTVAVCCSEVDAGDGTWIYNFALRNLSNVEGQSVYDFTLELDPEAHVWDIACPDGWIFISLEKPFRCGRYRGFVSWTGDPSPDGGGVPPGGQLDGFRLRADSQITSWPVETIVLNPLDPEDPIVDIGEVVTGAPIAGAGPPQTVEQAGRSGTQVTLDATGSSDPDGTIEGFAWDTDGDGDFDDATGPTPTLLLALGVWAIHVQVTDDEGVINTAGTTVSVVDTTAPAIAAPADLEVWEADPRGTHVDLGQPTVSDACDAQPDVGNNASGLFLLGTTTVTWTATDGSGNSASTAQSVAVVPGSALNQLDNLAKVIRYGVSDGNVAPEIESALLAKVDAARAALVAGNPNAAKVAVNDLKALVNQVEAQTDKKIAPDVAAEIIERANRIIAALGG